MTLEMHNDEFEEFSAIASAFRRRGSMPLVNPEVTERIRNPPRRTKSLKAPRKKREGQNLSPLVRDEMEEASLLENKNNSGVYSATLRVPSPCFGAGTQSAPHSRSNSWKKNYRPSPVRNGGGTRSRTSSLSTDETDNNDNEVCPVRSFQISSRGLVNRGDSFKYRSNVSVASSLASNQSYSSLANSTQPSGAGAKEASERHDSINSENSALPNEEENHPYSVLILGKTGVGKTTVIRQLLTSEHVGTKENHSEFQDRQSVSVLLNGHEYNMDVYEVGQREDCRSYDDIDAYLVIYSIEDRDSFDAAAEILYTICSDQCKNVAIIIVGNKTDLVRSREVSQEEGKELAVTYNCKYIEVSAALNIKMDELLVGLVHQVELNPERDAKKKKVPTATLR